MHNKHVWLCVYEMLMFLDRGYVHTVKTKGRMVIVSVRSVCALQIQSTSMEPVSTKLEFYCTHLNTRSTFIFLCIVEYCYTHE